MGEPLYMIERMNLTTGKGFGDGEHILYVNGQYPGESDLWKLMHDYNCTEADNMNFDLMAEHTRYLKENPKRVQEMCKEIQMFGFLCTSKLLSYPNLFFQNTESVQIQANKRFGFFILFMYMLNRL